MLNFIKLRLNLRNDERISGESFWNSLSFNDMNLLKRIANKIIG